MVLIRVVDKSLEESRDYIRSVYIDNNIPNDEDSKIKFLQIRLGYGPCSSVTKSGVLSSLESDLLEVETDIRREIG